ncbi:hypothetical protein TNCV_3821631 [Trichonephila clavipes]|nr:hypothetical protein TNCV_3821631 [Trichonephila clavipes]
MCTCILPEKCRINIKFLVKLKKSTTKTFQKLTGAYGDETLSAISGFQGKKGSADDDEPAGRPRGLRKNGESHNGLTKTFVPELLPAMEEWSVNA